MRTLLFSLFVFTVLGACSLPARIQRAAQQTVLADAALRTAHVGISIYEPATGRWWYNYQGDKYFVPASNTKLATCYAALRHLGDSLVGLEYFLDDTVMVFRGTGDPTLLHPDFNNQPVLGRLRNEKRRLALAPANFLDHRWGPGWAVSDINAAYAPEKSELPVYGNVLRLYKHKDSIVSMPSSLQSFRRPSAAANWLISFERPSLNENVFRPIAAAQPFRSQTIPFVTGNHLSAWVLLMDTLQKNILYREKTNTQKFSWQKIRSQPTDSLLRPMMQRSDNFFAEQALLMVSNEMLGLMSNEQVIDTLLKTDFSDLPQKPRWVDGSGLSRYNLFTPQGLMMILHKMDSSFGRERIRNILPTGNEGTLAGYYKADSSFLFAKTGTLSGVVALSGFLATAGGREVVFSVLVNNHQGPATQVRRAVERFLQKLRKQH